MEQSRLPNGERRAQSIGGYEEHSVSGLTHGKFYGLPLVYTILEKIQYVLIAEKILNENIYLLVQVLIATTKKIVYNKNISSLFS
ncbi:hypothetical protein KSD_50480 [Ktedonobacter sp. SOSP1-85]|nr:hypothetical protein KSD_50480 [Ktedonobacter sp. SOSP1-85]